MGHSKPRLGGLAFRSADISRTLIWLAVEEANQMSGAAAWSKRAFSPFLVFATLLVFAVSGVALGYMWIEAQSTQAPVPSALAIEEISFGQELDRNPIYVRVRNTGSTNATVIGVSVNNRSMVYARGFAISGLYVIGNLSAGDRWTVTSVHSVRGSGVDLASRARYSEIKPGELLEMKILFGVEGWESGVAYTVRVTGMGGVWDEGRAAPK